jgi:hypothetical protein
MWPAAGEGAASVFGIVCSMEQIDLSKEKAMSNEQMRILFTAQSPFG